MIKIKDKIIDINESEETRTYYIRTIFRELLEENNLTIRAAVRLYNEKFPEHPTTSQNISNKFTRDAMKFRDVVEFAEAIGYDIRFVRHHDADEYEPEIDSSKVTPISPKSIQAVIEPDDVLRAAMAQGVEFITFVKLGKVIIAGKQAKQAEKWIRENSTFPHTSEASEMTLIATASNVFDVIVKPLKYLN